MEVRSIPRRRAFATSRFRLTSSFYFALQTSHFLTSDFKRQTSNFQNTILRLTCVCRADVMVLLMRPNVASGASPSAWPANARSSGDAEIGAVEQVEHLEAQLDAGVARRARSTVLLLLNARSSVRRFGPVKSPRPVLPNVPGRLQDERRGIEPLLRRPVDRAVRVVARRVAWPVLTDARARATDSTASAIGSRSRTPSAAVRCASSRCRTPASRRRAHAPRALRSSRTAAPT